MENRNKWMVAGFGTVLVVALVIVLAAAGGRGEGGRGLVLEEAVEISDADKMLVERDIAVTKQAIEAQESLTSDEKEWDWNLYTDLAYSYRLVGDLQGAREAYERYFELNSINFAMWNEYAKTLEKMGDLRQAEMAYLQAVDLNATEANIRDAVEFWKTHYPDEREEDIRNLLEAAVDGGGKAAYYFVELGQWHYRAGNCVEAVGHYELLVDMLPGNENAVADLATMRDLCSE